MRRSLLFVLLLLVAGLMIPGAAALNVVTTMPSVYDVTKEVGGDQTTVIYVQSPASVHITPETLDAAILRLSPDIRTADLFIAQGGMDDTAIEKITEHVNTYYAGKTDPEAVKALAVYADTKKITTWNDKDLGHNLGEGNNAYNHPEWVQQYAATVCKFLMEKDPTNESVYYANWEAYCTKVQEATTLTDEEEEIFTTTPVINHYYVWEQACAWLGMPSLVNGVTTETQGGFPRGNPVATIVTDIQTNPAKYSESAANAYGGRILVLENQVAGEVAKSIDETLGDQGIGHYRLILQNQPKMIPGVDSILDMLVYNKNQILTAAKEYPRMKIVATMANVGDVTRQIGGRYVTVIMGPGEAVHQSAETLNGWMQTNSKFIFTADAFFAQDSGEGMDHNAVTYVTDFRRTNKGLSTDWKVIEAVTEEQAGTPVTNDYDHPEALKLYSAAVCYMLKQVDPVHAEQFEENLDAYIARIDSETALTAGELNALEGTPVICMYYLQAQTHDWMQMDVLKAYFPSPAAVGAVVQDIIDNTQTYRDAANESATGKIFVIDNALCPNPKAGVPIHEKLVELGIPAERVVFQNMPGMVSGLNTMLDYYLYNKHLILPLVQYDSSEDSASSTSSLTSPGTFTFANALTVELTPAGTALPAGTKLTLGDVPENLPETGLPTQRTMEIHLENAQGSDISGATFEFGVPTGIITAAGYGQYDIIMMRLVDGVWTELPTTFSYEANGMTYYTAETPGFSVFTVAYKKGATAEAVPKTDTEGPELKPVDTTATATTPTTEAAATTATATASPTQTKAPAPLFGLLAGLAAAAVLLPRIR